MGFSTARKTSKCIVPETSSSITRGMGLSHGGIMSLAVTSAMSPIQSQQSSQPTGAASDVIARARNVMSGFGGLVRSKAISSKQATMASGTSAPLLRGLPGREGTEKTPGRGRSSGILLVRAVPYGFSKGWMRVSAWLYGWSLGGPS
jgi:hypothetical protein